MSGTRWLDEREQRAWRAYVTMNARLTERLNRQLQLDSGLSGADFQVLVHLTDLAEGPVRVVEMARELEWEKSRLSHHLARMQRRGLVDRQECPDDARGAFVVLTPQGRQAIEQAAPGHVETVRQLFVDQLTGEELDTLRTIAERVLSRLDAAAPTRPGSGTR
jgi:DNA-binding MarR family transcriptional regulator